MPITLLTKEQASALKTAYENGMKSAGKMNNHEIEWLARDHNLTKKKIMVIIVSTLYLFS